VKNINYTIKYVVLVLDWIELILFIVAGMVLVWICDENSVDNTGKF